MYLLYKVTHTCMNLFAHGCMNTSRQHEQETHTCAEQPPCNWVQELARYVLLCIELQELCTAMVHRQQTHTSLQILIHVRPGLSRVLLVLCMDRRTHPGDLCVGVFGALQMTNSEVGCNLKLYD